MSDVESLDQVAFLLEERLLKVCPYEEDSDPRREPVAFVASIPRPLLSERRDRLRRGEDLPEWYLLTDEGEGQWDEELRAYHGVLVVPVDDLSKARERLISILARRDAASAARASRRTRLLAGGSVRKLDREEPVYA